MRFIRLLGSLTIAVPLLVTIGIVLAWGTIYEARFGTAAVQRFIYHAWWFQALLAFLAVNLAVAALERYPWKRRQAPFVLAHLGIILVLVGGIIGSRFGIEGQLIIPEGQAERLLQLPGNVLVVHQPNPGLHRVFPTNFETQAWVHEPHRTIPVLIDPSTRATALAGGPSLGMSPPTRRGVVLSERSESKDDGRGAPGLPGGLHGRAIQLTVDRYYPDAVTEEQVSDGGAEENPAIQVALRHEIQEGAFWLIARDPERFGTRWGDAHVVFLEPATEDQMRRLLSPPASESHPRGVVALQFEGKARTVAIPVPEDFSRPVEIDGTPYRLTFKDYFPDFAITEQGLTSRSEQPNNPAVSFALSGPEGTDAYLLFAMHPDIQSLHGWTHTIKVRTTYDHPTASALPPDAVAILRDASGHLAAVLTGSSGERTVLERLQPGKPYTHPGLAYEFTVVAYYPRATVTQSITNRSDEVRSEALHLLGREGEQTAEAWVGLRGEAELVLGKEPITVEYRPDQRELPFTIKLLDFRKIDYPGIRMAAGFESDIQLMDPARGIILMRKISMNNPLRYRGYSFYQSSYIPGAVETTVLSVRNDPGTPLVCAGFLIVIGGVVAMFLLHTEPAAGTARPRRRRSRRRS